MSSGGNVGQRSEILTVGADVHGVVVDGVFISSHRPLQSFSGDRSRQRQTIVDPGLDFGAFLVVIPGHQLQGRQLFARAGAGVEAGKGLQPGLAALLSHDAVGTP